MKFKILTDRIPAYKKDEIVETHAKGTNYRALCNLVYQGEADIIEGVTPRSIRRKIPVVKKLIRRAKKK